jgi:hypothetical protein
MKCNIIQYKLLLYKEAENFQTLPQVNSLREAVQTVIKSNKKDGYSPNRLIQMVTVNDLELIRVCSSIILKPESLSALYTAISDDHPNLLTIEDFIAVHGQSWGLSLEVAKEAEIRCKLFDDWAKRKRYNLC